MEKKKSVINEYNIFGLTVQAILTIVLIVVAIISIFNHSLLWLLEILMGLDLFIMGYNNHRVYRRMGATPLYLAVGAIMVVIGILTVLGVL